MRQFPSTKKKWTSLVLSLTAGNVRFPIRPRCLFEHSSPPLTQLAIYLFISSLSSIHWEKFNTDMHFNCVLSLYKNSILCLPQLAGKTLLAITVLFLLSLHISSSRSTTPHHTYKHTLTHLHTQIYNHTRHVQFNLMQLERKQVSPPFKPRLDSDRDLANFPIEFTGEPVQLTPDDE